MSMFNQLLMAKKKGVDRSGDYYTPGQQRPINDYLCFTAQEGNCTVALEKYGSAYDVALEYSMNRQTWDVYTIGNTITLTNAGDRVYFRGINTHFSRNTTYVESNARSMYNHFVLSGLLEASGTIMSLLDPWNVVDVGNMPNSSSEFNHLFYQCSALTKAPSIGSFSIDRAPSQYQGWFFCAFEACTNLATMPDDMPVFTPKYMTCAYMFRRCTSLESARLHHGTTTGGDYAMRNMFEGCTSLKRIEVDFSEWSLSNATTSWVDGVAASGTFVCPTALPQNFSANRIPSGWTVVTK